MKKYIGTKVIMAEPLTMIEAQKVLGRELKSATLEEDGYLVEYKDGYKSWSPKSMFEEAYHEVDSINFGGANKHNILWKVMGIFRMHLKSWRSKL